MPVVSFNEKLTFLEGKVSTKVILETPFSKEIRVLIKEGNIMKEHKAPAPITIHVLSGKIILGHEGQKNTLAEGDIIGLDAHVLHDLNAIEDSIIRLTLSKK